MMPPSLPLAGEVAAPSPAPCGLARKGFRPFFLLAALAACAIVPIWVLVLFGYLQPGPDFDVVNWHAHEMLFGFTVAVIAGFLLTAVGNWTGRETVVGEKLLALAGLWLVGRLAPALPRVAMAADLAFLPVLAVVLARPLIAARNRRNFVMLGILAALFAATHALTVGAIGSLTLGMMARVALGHTGRPLAAPKAMAVGFALVTVAALVRVGGPLLAPAFYGPALVASGALWTVAFAIYLRVYAPILLRPRVDGRPG